MMKVKRTQEIISLRSRYHRLLRSRKIKSANLVWRRLSDLMLRQLKAENRGQG